MIEEKSKVPNRTLYELIAKDGRVVGTFRTALEAADMARSAWPDQEQDEDRTGAGWDVQIAGCE
jgi:hypothetical protein